MQEFNDRMKAGAVAALQSDRSYKFDELDERAKERARDWYRQGAFEYEWWDEVFEDAKQCLALAGFTIDRIYFSGFSSQGDGACFEGSWRAANAQPVKAMKQHAPQDKDLHAIAAAMREVAKARPDASMSVKHRGRYSHEHCTEFDVSADGPEWDDDVRRSDAEWSALRDREAEIEETIIETSRDAMRWIYRQLEREYDYLNSDEQVDEAIRANEYEFNQDGSRA